MLNYINSIYTSPNHCPMCRALGHLRFSMPHKNTYECRGWYNSKGCGAVWSHHKDKQCISVNKNDTLTLITHETLYIGPLHSELMFGINT